MRILQDFSWAHEAINRSRAEPRYNVAPGTYRPVMHVEGPVLLVDDLHWVCMAVPARFGEETEKKANTGCTIVTADAQGGMVDVHDRRPVVCTTADAATWLDPATPHELPEQRTCARPFSITAAVQIQSICARFDVPPSKNLLKIFDRKHAAGR